MDWIIKHGQTALKPSRRAGNLLLAHKITTVRNALIFIHSLHSLVVGTLAPQTRLLAYLRRIELTSGPLRTSRHDPRSRLMELLVPQLDLPYSSIAFLRECRRC